MNKTKKIWTLSLALAALLALTLSLTSCAQKDDGDYFSSSSSIGTYKWNDYYPKIPVYMYEPFSHTYLDDTGVTGFALILDDPFPNTKDYWSYIVYFQTNYVDENGEYTGEWADRQVFVKTKTQALKVYDELLFYKEKPIKTNNLFRTYYGIDYDPAVLMSDNPINYEVQNMTGDTFSKSEIIYSYLNDGETTPRKVFEERFVYSGYDGTETKNSYFQIAELKNTANTEWKYFVHFHTNWYDSEGNWKTYLGREVYCKKKSEAKKVFKDMLNMFKENPNLFINLNSETNEQYIGQSYGYDYNLSKLIK